MNEIEDLKESTQEKIGVVVGFIISFAVVIVLWIMFANR